VRGNAYEMPIKNDSVDAIFSNNVWFHLGEIERAAANMSQALKPGGDYYIITRNPKTYDVLVNKGFRNAVQEGKKVTGALILPSGDTPKTVVYLHSLEEMVGSLEDSGLVVDVVESFDSVNTKDFFLAIKGHKRTPYQ
jgi:SAM-dependent methyltransferase